jgi:hypothetical protein
MPSDVGAGSRSTTAAAGAAADIWGTWVLYPLSLQ